METNDHRRNITQPLGGGGGGGGGVVVEGGGGGSHTTLSRGQAIGHQAHHICAEVISGLQLLKQRAAFIEAQAQAKQQQHQEEEWRKQSSSSASRSKTAMRSLALDKSSTDFASQSMSISKQMSIVRTEEDNDQQPPQSSWMEEGNQENNLNNANGSGSGSGHDDDLQSFILQRQMLGQLREIMELRLKVEKRDKRLSQSEAILSSQRSEIGALKAALNVHRSSYAMDGGCGSSDWGDEDSSSRTVNNIQASLASYKNDEIQALHTVISNAQMQQAKLKDEVLSYQSSLRRFRRELELQASHTVAVVKRNESLEAENRHIQSQLVHQSSALETSRCQLDSIHTSITSYETKIKTLADESKNLIGILEADVRVRYSLESMLKESTAKYEATAELLLKSETAIGELRESHISNCNSYKSRIIELETNSNNNSNSNSNSNNAASGSISPASLVTNSGRNNQNKSINTESLGMDIDAEADRSKHAKTLASREEAVKSGKQQQSTGTSSGFTSTSKIVDLSGTSKQSGEGGSGGGGGNAAFGRNQKPLISNATSSTSVQPRNIEKNNRCCKCGEVSLGVMIACTTCTHWAHLSCAREMHKSLLPDPSSAEATSSTLPSFSTLRSLFQCYSCKPTDF